MREFIETARTLSDPGRARILLALRGRELCVCQMVELLGLAPSTVSRHLALLHRAGLVELRKEGRWAYYRRAGRKAPPLAKAALRWLDASLEGDEVLRADQAKLKRILETPLEKLCGGSA